MSVTVTRDAVGMPEKGMIIMDAMLVLYEASQHKPRTATAVWLVLETNDGDFCWELGEWSDGKGMRPKGWYLVGVDKPLDDTDYTVRHWCYEPTLPALVTGGSLQEDAVGTRP